MKLHPMVLVRPMVLGLCIVAGTPLLASAQAVDCPIFVDKFQSVGGHAIKEYNHFGGAFHDRTPEQCAQACSERLTCASFDYNKKTRACVLSKETRRTVPQAFVADPTGTWDYYERVRRPENKDFSGFLATRGRAIPGRNACTYNAIDVGYCADLCRSQSWCKSFDYGPAAKSCSLSQSAAGEPGVALGNYPAAEYYVKAEYAEAGARGTAATKPAARDEHGGTCVLKPKLARLIAEVREHDARIDRLTANFAETRRLADAARAEIDGWAICFDKDKAKLQVERPLIVKAFALSLQGMGVFAPSPGIDAAVTLISLGMDEIEDNRRDRVSHARGIEILGKMKTFDKAIEDSTTNALCLVDKAQTAFHERVAAAKSDVELMARRLKANPSCTDELFRQESFYAQAALEEIDRVLERRRRDPNRSALCRN